MPSNVPANMQVQPSPNSQKRKGEDENSNPNKRMKLIPDTSNPKYKEPFKYPEWQRELVYRNRSNMKNSPIADVNYYLKFNLDEKIIKYKLRSLVEISNKLSEFEKYLESNGQPPSGLTIDNFTLVQKPLGFNDKNKEIVRKAKRVFSRKHLVKKRSRKWVPRLPKPILENSGVKEAENEQVTENYKETSYLTTSQYDTSDVSNLGNTSTLEKFDPQFLEPFKYPEWHRQVVFGSNPDIKKKANHTYYFYNNIKLKTKEQIKEKIFELDKKLQSKGQPISGLTVENFTFKYATLGTNDSTKESVRYAVPRESKKKVLVKKLTKKYTKSTVKNSSTFSLAKIESLNKSDLVKNGTGSKKNLSFTMKKNFNGSFETSESNMSVTNDDYDLSEPESGSYLKSCDQEKIDRLIRQKLELEAKHADDIEKFKSPAYIELENKYKNMEFEYRNLLIEKNVIEKDQKNLSEKKSIVEDELKSVKKDLNFEQKSRKSLQLELKEEKNKNISLSEENESLHNKSIKSQTDIENERSLFSNTIKEFENRIKSIKTSYEQDVKNAEIKCQDNHKIEMDLLKTKHEEEMNILILKYEEERNIFKLKYEEEIKKIEEEKNNLEIKVKEEAEKNLQLEADMINYKSSKKSVLEQIASSFQNLFD